MLADQQPTAATGANSAQASKQEYVLLSPDKQTVTILLPSENGVSKIVQTIHNRIDATVKVQMERHNGTFEYRYAISSAPDSQDSVTNLLIVVSPDLNVQVAPQSRWMGAASTSVVARRLGLRNAPLGCFLDWFAPESNPLAPGNSADDLLVESSGKPGFTTAYMIHEPPLQSSLDWPEEVLDQLESITKSDWFDKHTVIFGPRYAPNDSPGKIANDYLTGIADLIREERLAPNSPVVQEIRSQLRQVAQPGGVVEPITLNQKPISELERELQQALILCFSK
ncbi:MAG TPA: hypothetical protein VFB14_29605 [Bryobacteraceae bacterium]|nr:hypothetical protein [Bryobacteraceae bacterium]